MVLAKGQNQRVPNYGTTDQKVIITERTETMSELLGTASKIDSGNDHKKFSVGACMGTAVDQARMLNCSYSKGKPAFPDQESSLPIISSPPHSTHKVFPLNYQYHNRQHKPAVFLISTRLCYSPVADPKLQKIPRSCKQGLEKGASCVQKAN